MVTMLVVSLTISKLSEKEEWECLFFSPLITELSLFSLILTQGKEVGYQKSQMQLEWETLDFKARLHIFKGTQ